MDDAVLNIGYNNFICSSRIIAVVNPDSAPIKRMIQEMRSNGSLIDATCGRKTRSVIIMDSRHVVLSAILPETIIQRLGEYNG